MDYHSSISLIDNPSVKNQIGFCQLPLHKEAFSQLSNIAQHHRLSPVVSKCALIVYRLTTAETLSKITNAQITDNSSGKPFQTTISLAEMFSKGFISIQAVNNQLLSKVEYTDDTEKLYPRILKEEGEGFSLALGKLGKYKNLYWAFQREWRYILNILPLDLNQPVKNQ